MLVALPRGFLACWVLRWLVFLLLLLFWCWCWISITLDTGDSPLSPCFMFRIV